MHGSLVVAGCEIKSSLVVYKVSSLYCIHVIYINIPLLGWHDS